jgi:transcriptional regulator with XRE-family HTH domain
MISKAELGRRLREARVERNMTLKQLDQESGFSATHISEIERGKTSPTIGALIRIANALGKEPSYFIEEDVLPETSLTLRDKRSAWARGGAQVETLSAGIPGGRLYAYLLRLSPDGPALELEEGEGEEGGYVLKGRVEYTVGPEKHGLGSGDAIHYTIGQVRSLKATGSEAEVVLITTTRLQGS